MIIGTFTKNSDGSFSGSIHTLSLKADAVFKPIERSKEKAPDYRLSAGSVEVGAAWREQSQAGKAYLSVQLDDPSFASSIHAALVKSDSGYNLVWERPSKRRDNKPASNGEF